jgi:hypothetical protein
VQPAATREITRKNDQASGVAPSFLFFNYSPSHFVDGMEVFDSRKTSSNILAEQSDRQSRIEGSVTRAPLCPTTSVM